MSEHFFIAGPCVIESESLVMNVAERLKTFAERFGVEMIFKSSFDKANRTSLSSFRGPGIDEGLRILSRVKEEFGFSVTTDIHLPQQASIVGDVADIIQIPAFLCRQTDIVVAAAETGKAVNIKKGQFMAPWDMKYVIDKVLSTGNSNVMVTERGTCFGYNNLVVDFRGIVVMKGFGYPVVYDATHSMQLPSRGGVSGGTPEYAKWLACAAASVGVDGLFFEVHTNPKNALSDASVMLSLEEFEEVVPLVLEHWAVFDGYEKT